MDEKKFKNELISRRQFFHKGVTGLLPLFVIASGGNLLQSCVSKLTDDGESSEGGSDSSGDMFPLSQAGGTIGGLEYVDLGLSIKWGRCNLGSKNPESFGVYFKELPYVNEEAPLPNYNGYSQGDDIAGTIYDAAHASYGNGWKLPTLKQYKELIKSCDKEVHKINGVLGLVFISKKNQNSIFFPFTGYQLYNKETKSYDTMEVGETGHYYDGTLAVKSNQGMTIMDKTGATSTGVVIKGGTFKMTIRAVNSKSGSSGGESGCNNNCSNSATSSSCHGCGQSCSGSCTNGCSVNCGGACTTSCGGTCTYLSAGSSCSGCAKTCYNQCYASCSTLCYTTCRNDCINSSY